MVNEEEFIDEDVEQIAGSDIDTDLITKLNSPINILLLVLIVIVIISIVLVLTLM